MLSYHPLSDPLNGTLVCLTLLTDDKDPIYNQESDIAKKRQHENFDHDHDDHRILQVFLSQRDSAIFSRYMMIHESMYDDDWNL